MTIRFREERNYSKLASFIEKYQDNFADMTDLQHILLMVRKDNLNTNLESLLSLLQDSQRNAEKQAQNPGSLHLFAEIVATILEKIHGDMFQKLKGDWLESGLKAVQRAISINENYAKYYATKARLLALDQGYDEAFYNIDQAVDREDSARKDYQSRVNSYEHIRTQILNQKVNRELEAQLEEIRTSFETTVADHAQKMTAMEEELSLKMKDHEEKIDLKNEMMLEKMDEMNIKMIEMLGLFAGLIGFVVGGLQVASNQSFHDASRLIIVFMGALICAYSSFGFIVHKLTRENLIRSFITLAVGFVIIIGGFILCSIP